MSEAASMDQQHADEKSVRLKVGNVTVQVAWPGPDSEAEGRVVLRRLMALPALEEAVGHLFEKVQARLLAGESLFGAEETRLFMDLQRALAGEAGALAVEKRELAEKLEAGATARSALEARASKLQAQVEELEAQVLQVVQDYAELRRHAAASADSALFYLRMWGKAESEGPAHAPAQRPLTRDSPLYFRCLPPPLRPKSSLAEGWRKMLQSMGYVVDMPPRPAGKAYSDDWTPVHPVPSLVREAVEKLLSLHPEVSRLSGPPGFAGVARTTQRTMQAPPGRPLVQVRNLDGAVTVACLSEGEWCPPERVESQDVLRAALFALARAADSLVERAERAEARVLRFERHMQGVEQQLAQVRAALPKRTWAASSLGECVRQVVGESQQHWRAFERLLDALPKEHELRVRGRQTGWNISLMDLVDALHPGPAEPAAPTAS